MTQWGVATDAGGRRSVNEDAALAEAPVFVVADGMGGHARGEMASQTVVEVFRELAGGPARDITAADVDEAVLEAAARIRRTMAAESVSGWAETDGREAVAGTTVAGVVLTAQDGDPYWLVLNVGDSRVYRFAGERLEQISVDHSLVQEMVDAGTLDPAMARTHPRRNVITRAIGSGRDCAVDFWMLRVHPAERILLCTDGLIGELDDAQITEVLSTVADPAQAAQTLVCRAVTGGASDNVTVVVVDAPAEVTTTGTTVRTAGSGATPGEGDDEDEAGSTLPGGTRRG